MNYVYLLRCADDSLYCGWTNDLTARLAAHNSGHGAKYTRGRGPVRLVYSEVLPSKGEALSREAQIKHLSRAEKEALLRTQTDGELLTVYDADDRACGERPREIVHRQGLRHRVCHLWVLGVRGGVAGLWLQQRAPSKTLYPGWFDLSATGHIDPGETPVQAMQREAREEIGLHLTAAQLLPIGRFAQAYDRAEAGGFDDEISFSFVVRIDDVPPFVPGEEVTQLLFVPLAAFDRAHRETAPLAALDQTGRPLTLPHDRLCCLHEAEWDGVERFLAENKAFEDKKISV